MLSDPASVVVAGARGAFLLLMLEIPPPLDRDLLVVGRGWLLLHEGSSSLIWSRTDRADAGIRTSLSPDQWESGVRYTLRGRLSADDTFVVSEVARSSLQNPSDIGPRELRALGCAGRTTLSIIILMTDQWADTPLDTLAVFAFYKGAARPPRRQRPGRARGSARACLHGLSDDVEVPSRCVALRPQHLDSPAVEVIEDTLSIISRVEVTAFGVLPGAENVPSLPLRADRGAHRQAADRDTTAGPDEARRYTVCGAGFEVAAPAPHFLAGLEPSPPHGQGQMTP